MRHWFRAAICFAFFLTGRPDALAQTDSLPAKDTVDYYEMSLEQLLTLKAHGIPSELEALINSLISVASKKPLNTRESPSIVTLITEEEIRASGARDLMDVLRLVPGFDFGMDVEGVVGIGIRGNWAHEGKVLLLLDGQELNEMLFATTQFGNHIPAEHIKKIEIIRGPGSAIYGGFAEYGVINIVTRSGGDLNGISATGIYGQMKDAFARRNFSLSGGKKWKDFELSLAGLAGEGNRSDREFTDLYGGSYLMGGNSSLNPLHVNLGMAWKNLSFRAILDNLTTSVRDGYDGVQSQPYIEKFNSFLTELKYNYKVNQKLTITPHLNFKRQVPWKTAAMDSTGSDYFKVAYRYLGNVSALYHISRKVNVVFGAEGYRDEAWDKADSGYFSNGKTRVDYFNLAFFAQGLVKTRLVNFILGARYDKHNEYGDAFVPRVGLTKKFDRLHFKALFSNSFRAPSIENINYATDAGIKPEMTTVGELELGYQITRNLLFTVNLFDITTKDPIIYYYDEVNMTDGYINLGESGTRGLEAEIRIKEKWGFITANYSFYTAAGKQRVDDYAVEEDASQLLAFSPHSANISSGIKITRHLFVHASLVYRGKRWANTAVDTTGELVAEETDAYGLLNLFVRYENAGIKGLSVGAGVYDLFDKKPAFIQPYKGFHAPLPGPSREWIIRLTYDLSFTSSSGKKP